MDLPSYLKGERGRTQRLADALKVSGSLVTQWCNGKTVADERTWEIEALTEGKVTCEEMRRDLHWMRVPDPSWPWHPKGRPVLDVTRGKRPAREVA